MKQMTTQVVVRLPHTLNARLRRRARASHRRPSEIVRLAIEAYLGESLATPWELTRDLCGSVSGGPPDLSTNKKYLLKALRGRI